MTAEDPVEFYLKGVGQIQANNEIGLTFEAILKSFKTRPRSNFSWRN